MTNFYIETTRGTVVLSTPRQTRQSTRQLVVLLHGAFADASVFDDLAARLGDVDVVRAHLPDHGGPALDQPSVAAYSEAIGQALALLAPGRPFLAVGESLGGLVALGLAASSVVAFDPPLSPSGNATLGELLAARDQAQLAKAYFGDPSDRRDYWPLLDRADRPVHIVTGTVAQSDVMIPRLLSPADFDRLAAYANVKVSAVGGVGHLVLRDAPDLAYVAVRRALQALGGPPPSISAAPGG